MKIRYLVLKIIIAILSAPPAEAGFFNQLNFAVGEFGGGTGVTTLTNPDGTLANYNALGLQGVARLPLFGNHKDFAEFGVMATMHYITLTNSGKISGESESGFLLGPGVGAYLRIWKLVVGAEEDVLLARHYATGRSSLVLNYTMYETRMFAGIRLGVIDRFGVSLMGSTGSALVPKESTGLSQSSPYQDQMIFLNVTYTPGN
jgi:hypothetical protein